MKIWIMDEVSLGKISLARSVEFADGTRIEEALKGLEAKALREHKIYVGDCRTSTEALEAYGFSQLGGSPRESSLEVSGDFTPTHLYEIVTNF